MVNNSGVPKVLNKETTQFLNAELDRLYKLVDPSNSNQETIKWAMDRITQIQQTVLGIAMSSTVEISDSPVVQAVSDISQNT